MHVLHGALWFLFLLTHSHSLILLLFDVYSYGTYELVISISDERTPTHITIPSERNNYLISVSKGILHTSCCQCSFHRHASIIILSAILVTNISSKLLWQDFGSDLMTVFPNVRDAEKELLRTDPMRASSLQVCVFHTLCMTFCIQASLWLRSMHICASNLTTCDACLHSCVVYHVHQKTPTCLINANCFFCGHFLDAVIEFSKFPQPDTI